MRKMSLKSKGITAERELVHLFWKKQIPAIRVAGSGSSRYPSPDVIAGTPSRKFAIECKSVKSTSKYLSKEEVEALLEFAALFGCEPWFAIRFAKCEWYFLSAEDLKESAKSFSISAVDAKFKGILFEELIL